MIREKIFKELITRNILTVSDNRIRILDSIDITTYDSKGWTYSLYEIGKAKGEDYLYELGYVMGKEAAQEIKEVTTRKKGFIPKVFSMIDNIIEICGFGIINISENDNRVKVEVEKHHILEFALEMYQDKHLISNFYCGIYSAYLNILQDKNIRLRIESCPNEKNSKCIFSS